MKNANGAVKLVTFLAMGLIVGVSSITLGGRLYQSGHPCGSRSAYATPYATDCTIVDDTLASR